MTSLDPRIADALGREVPLRVELEPAWDDVLVRTQGARRPRRRLGGRWAVVAALAATAGLGVGGLAIADVVGTSPPLRRATIYVDATTLANGMSSCDLINRPAARVAAQLSNAGIAVEWRYTHWGTTVAATTAGPAPATPREKALANGHAAAVEIGSAEAVTGGSSDAVSSVPGDSNVWDVVPDGSAKAFVFVEAPDDPNAPMAVAPDSCPG